GVSVTDRHVDSATTACVGEPGEPRQELPRHSRHALLDGHEGPAAEARSDADVAARLDGVPAVDEEQRGLSGLGDLPANVLEEQIDEPGRALAYVGHAVQIESVSVLAAVDDRRGVEAVRKLDRQLGSVQIVDLARGFLERRGARAAPAMRGYKEERLPARDPHQPIGEDGAGLHNPINTTDAAQGQPGGPWAKRQPRTETIRRGETGGLARSVVRVTSARSTARRNPINSPERAL